MLALCTGRPLRTTFTSLPAEGAVERARRVRQRPQPASKPCYGDDRRPTEQPRWAGNPCRRKTEIAKRDRWRIAVERIGVIRRARIDDFGKTLQSRERTMIKVRRHESRRACERLDNGSDARLVRRRRFAR